VRPAFAWVGSGDTLRLTATPLDSLDRPLPATFLAWSLEDDGILKFVGVPRFGEIVVVAVKPGRIRAYAELEGRSAATLIQIGTAIRAPEVMAVRIGWSSQRPAIGDTVALQAQVRGPGGTLLPGRRVVWSVSDPAIVRVWSFVPMRSQRISYRAALPGTVLVRARSGAAEDTVRLVVPCPGPSPSPDRKSPMNRHH
jgi:hypothetical protein